MSLFYFFGGWTAHHPTPGSPCIPRRYTPAPSSAPGRTAQRRPYQIPGQTMQDRTHRYTRPDAGHAAPVRTRYQTAHAGQIVTVRDAGGRGVRPKLSRFGQRNFTILCQKNKSEKSYIFAQNVLTYKIYLI